MAKPNFFILYVNDPVVSAAFYAGLLERQPVEASPTFALFALESGVMLGLWSRHTVNPARDHAKAGVGGGGEVAFAVDSKATVMQMHDAWKERCLPIAQAPVDLDFGFTFVALDPDGHRLRVFAPHD
jgi:catechol 2,3-dioxygenase-like lactoylglutathione lyase family enzyme